MKIVKLQKSNLIVRLSMPMHEQNKKNNEEIGPLLNSNGEVTIDQKQMADILLNQYNSMFSTPVENIPNNKKFPRSNYEDMYDFYVTEEDIKIFLKKLKGLATPGPDGVFGWCFKYGGKFILEFIVECFNQSLEERTASSKTREAWISPT